jgi:ATP-dependent Clp protease, protease subunit
MEAIMSLSEPDRPPEIPYPFPPLRETPRRTEPVRVPLVEMPSSDPHEQLLAQRRIMLSGRLDDSAVNHLCAQLMALDGRSADPIELFVNSGGGPLSGIGAVLDVLDLMRAKVNVTCVGTAVGTAAIVLACATGERRAGHNTRIRLRVEDPADIAGTAEELEQRARDHRTELRRIGDLLASVTGAPPAEIARQLESGVALDADAAQSLGVIDRVVGRG